MIETLSGLILQNIPGFFVGIVTTLAAVFGKGFAKEYFEKRKTARAEKRKLANEILKIVSEGNTRGHKVKPRDTEHINFIATQLEGHHPKMAGELRKYASYWSSQITPYKQHSPKGEWKEDEKYYIDLQRDTRDLSNHLIEEAHKLKR